MKPPSERNQAIAARRAEGATFRAIADEFGLNTKRVKEIVTRVERYNRGAAILQTDPSSLRAREQREISLYPGSLARPRK